MHELHHNGAELTHVALSHLGSSQLLEQLLLLSVQASVPGLPGVVGAHRGVLQSQPLSCLPVDSCGIAQIPILIQGDVREYEDVFILRIILPGFPQSDRHSPDVLSAS